MAKFKALWNIASMNITLGVTGSISAYKAIDLTRELTKLNHKVRVILTRGALEFVKPTLFKYLGAEEVYAPLDDFNEKKNDDKVLHVELAKWSDQLVIAPLSANTLSKLVGAGADDLLSSVFLAWRKEKPITVFPAMNTEMLSHPFVQRNLNELTGLPFVYVAPTGAGELACGDIGAGKLLSVNEMLTLITSRTLLSSNKILLITAGATVAPLDEVRFLTNASSGKTAIPFIREALLRGHKVILLAGFYATNSLNDFTHHPAFEIKRVKTTNDMHEEVMKNFPLCDYYISTAAIGDIEFKAASKGKLKKNQLSLSLEIQKTPDILSEVIKIKSPHQKVIGFAAEANLDDDILKEKLTRKPVDLLVGTEVSSGLIGEGEAKGFGVEKNNYRISTSIDQLGEKQFLTKTEMASTVSQMIF